MNINWLVQALCAGIMSASVPAATKHDWWLITWTFLAGVAAYIMGKVQYPPNGKTDGKANGRAVLPVLFLLLLPGLASAQYAQPYPWSPLGRPPVIVEDS